MDFIFSLLIGGLIGWIIVRLVSRDIPGEITLNVVFGIVGAWIGYLLFPNWGPTLIGFPLLSALLGAVVVVLIVTSFNSIHHNRRS